MDERYRLVFRGEVLEGQHGAVVKKKLAQALGIKDEAKLEQMFAGKAVVIRKDADTKTAAKFQAAFKKSGARLRVLPVVLSMEELEAKEAAEQAQAEQARLDRERADALAAMPDQVGFGDTSAWALMPAGSPVLAEEEREEVEPVEVPTDHISLHKAVAFAVEDTAEEAEPVEINAPDFDVAAVGSVMAPATAEEPEVADLLLDVDFSIAEAGAALVKPSLPVEVPPALLESEFDLAEPGAVMGSGSEEQVVPPAPDVSHLTMVEEEVAEEVGEDEPANKLASFS